MWPAKAGRKAVVLMCACVLISSSHLCSSPQVSRFDGRRLATCSSTTCTLVNADMLAALKVAAQLPVEPTWKTSRREYEMRTAARERMAIQAQLDAQWFASPAVQARLKQSSSSPAVDYGRTSSALQPRGVPSLPLFSARALTETSSAATSGPFVPASRWAGGVVPYEISEGVFNLPDRQGSVIIAAAAKAMFEWMDASCVTFHQGELVQGGPVVRIGFVEIGTSHTRGVGNIVRELNIYSDRNWLISKLPRKASNTVLGGLHVNGLTTRPDFVHEFGHVLGFKHTQA